jgi:hypothetical protein
VELRRKVVEHERHGIVDRLRLDHVVIVEHEHDLPRAPRDLVDQRDQDVRDRRRRRTPHQFQRLRTDDLLHTLQRSDQMGEQA